MILEVNMEIGSKLKKNMDDKKLTISEFAILCDVSYYKMKKWINGEGLPRAHDVIKICRTLNISLDWMIRKN